MFVVNLCSRGGARLWLDWVLDSVQVFGNEVVMLVPFGVARAATDHW